MKRAVQVPGEDAALPLADEDEAIDPKDARISQLEQQNTALQAALTAAQEENLDLRDRLAGKPKVAAAPAAPRLIGEDWSDRTSADAKEAGVTRMVLCKDGYYVPPNLKAV